MSQGKTPVYVLLSFLTRTLTFPCREVSLCYLYCHGYLQLFPSMNSETTRNSMIAIPSSVRDISQCG